MQRRAHPFFSGIGCGAALLLALALLAIVYARGGAPFSPGPLAAAEGSDLPRATAGDFQSHAEFEADCARCHAPWRGVSSERCEACHVNVAEQRRAVVGLHGLLGDTSRCQACHTEHQGRAASLTHVSTAIFDHGQTGFSLARHERGYDGAPLPCGDCHVQEEYTAASVDCVSCHREAAPQFMAEHVALFGSDCLACHDGLDTMANFEHTFPLDHGDEGAIACAVCHEQTLSSYTCYNCHEHSPGEIREEHEDEGIYEFEDCVACHPTGREDEAEDDD